LGRPCTALLRLQAKATQRTLDPDGAEELEAEVRRTKRISPPGLGTLEFDPESDLVFDYGPPLPGHANGLVLRAFDERGNPYMTQTYYSDEKEAMGYPYPFGSAAEMLEMGRASGKSIAEMKRANECAHQNIQPRELSKQIRQIYEVMNACVDRGLRMEGVLPGGLSVKRRARAIHEQLLAERGNNLSQPHVSNDWLSVYALNVAARRKSAVHRPWPRRDFVPLWAAPTSKSKTPPKSRSSIILA